MGRQANSRIRMRVLQREFGRRCTSLRCGQHCDDTCRLPFDTEDFMGLDAEMQTDFFDCYADPNGIQRGLKLYRKRRKLTFPTARWIEGKRCLKAH